MGGTRRAAVKRWVRRAGGLAVVTALLAWPLLAATAPPCRYGAPRRMAALEDPRVAEASGIAASRRNPGVWWVHNDSGDEPRLFAVDTQGRARAVLRVVGAAAVDWEDIAAGPGPGGRPSLYIADTGNNEGTRTDLRVYRIPEPDLSGGELELRSEPAAVFPFRYPDGVYDAEALMVHPRTGRVYLVTKGLGETAGVYRFPEPLTENQEAALERAAGVRIPSPSIWGRMVTAADIAPDGARFVLRTYLSLLEFRAPDVDRFEEAFAAKPTVIEGPPERQGEAVAYAPNGHDLVTVGEGRNAVLYLVPCLAARER